MPIPLGEFGKYLVAGLGTLSEKELRRLPNSKRLLHMEPNKGLERTVEESISEWGLSQKADVLVRGIKSAGLTRDEKRDIWGSMLLHFYYGNMNQGTYSMGALMPFNNTLILDIEEDYIQRATLLSELGCERGYPIESLEMALQNPEIRNLSREFATMDEFMWFVKRESAGAFLRTAVKIVDKQAQIGTLVEILGEIYGQDILEEEITTILENIRSALSIGAVLREYQSKYVFGLYLYTGDERTDKLISQVVWRSVPRFIEENGYVLLESLITATIPAKLKVHARQELYDALASDKTLRGHSELFKNTTRGNLVYVAPDKQEFVNGYIQQVVKWYMLPEKEKRRLQRQQQEELLRNLVQYREEGNYGEAQKAAAELNTAGYNHWSLGLLLESTHLRQISSAEPTKQTKRELRRQLGPTIESYKARLAGNGATLSEIHGIVEQDLQALRDFEKRMRPVWGNNDEDVTYIRQRANILEGAIRTPALLETITSYLSAPFRRDYQWEMGEMARKAIKAQH